MIDLYGKSGWVTAEERFRGICYDLIDSGIHPTPTTIRRAQGRIGHNLNGRECKWLRSTVTTKAECTNVCCNWNPK